jgi:uncharacterized protein (DUF779 family)
MNAGADGDWVASVTSAATRERISATPEALELIERLEQRHGPVAFVQAEAGGQAE